MLLCEALTALGLRPRLWPWLLCTTAVAKAVAMAAMCSAQPTAAAAAVRLLLCAALTPLQLAAVV